MAQTFSAAELARELENIAGPEGVHVSEPMARHTTFEIGGPADVLVEPASADEAVAVLDYCAAHGVPCFVMGNGSDLLVGDKATGKNMLAENLAHAFGRPLWNVSFHINMDASYMIGTDTFRDGQVTFRPGPVYESALKGGFCVLDEINMARNEALAVLHSALDFRRVINVPGYDSICVHPAARFIATMNYGYAGTRELNEALTSRFMVIHMPQISAENLEKLIRRGFPTMKKTYVSQFVGLFNDIEKKCESGELSSRVLDLRGMLDAISLMKSGLAPVAALDMGMTNKTFDPYEQTLVRDVIAARIPAGTSAGEIFAG